MATTAEAPTDTFRPSPGDRRRLVVFSFLMLFVELALIRWAGANVLYLSFFSNFVLLGSFLGIGVGFLRARAAVDLSRYAPLALTVLVATVLLVPVEVDRTQEGLVFFGGKPTGLPIWVTLPAIFAMVAATLMMIGEGVARLFVKFEPLEAYRLDILGSICGIVAFAFLAILHAPSVVWGAVATAVLVGLLGYRQRSQVVCAVALVAMLASESLAPGISWSPYYKVKTTEYIGQDYTNIDVNGINHQAMTSIETRRELEPVYFVPYEWRTADGPGDVLIVGAGTGTDVAIALAEGATRVDAVEIDPRLQQIGEERHPNRPYDDPRVDVVINDGRAHLEQTGRRYDTILFALPDSLTLVAGQSSLRLESYLFTEEAITAAKSRLNDGGTFAMYNYYRERWLVDRLAGTLDQVFENSPCIDVASNNLAVMMTSADPAALDCDTTWAPASAGVPEPATDDHPFLYLRERTIPTFYLVTIALILLASLLLVRGAGGPLRPMLGYVDLFFMGVAFLLLETKSVVQFALLFGTTWFVNALVFAGVLVSVYLAVELAGHVRLPRRELLYGLLVVSLAVAWSIEPARLLDLGFGFRFVASVAITFTPIFIANLIFADRFRGVDASTTAFGANLLGAMVGGLLEYVSLITGYRALIPVVGLLYLAAFVSSRRAGDLAEGAAPAVAA